MLRKYWNNTIVHGKVQAFVQNFIGIPFPSDSQHIAFKRENRRTPGKRVKFFPGILKFQKIACI